MNYPIIYERLIKHALSQCRMKKPNDGLDRHHILPESLGGSNDKNNMVLLTGREHYLAHKLLVKIHKGENKKKMVYALWWMTKTKRKGLFSNKTRITARDYEYARNLFIQANVNNDPERKEKFKRNRAAGLYKYDNANMGKTLSNSLNLLTPDQKRERMLKSTMTADHQARCQAIRRGKASLIEIKYLNGDVTTIFSDQTMEYLGLTWPQIKYRIDAHNGLLKDGKKVIMIKKYTGGNKWKKT